MQDNGGLFIKIEYYEYQSMGIPFLTQIIVFLPAF